MSDYAITIRRQNGYMVASTSYPPRDGEDWSRGNDIADGSDEREFWGLMEDMADFLARNPGKLPEDWKEEFYRTPIN